MKKIYLILFIIFSTNSFAECNSVALYLHEENEESRVEALLIYEDNIYSAEIVDIEYDENSKIEGWATLFPLEVIKGEPEYLGMRFIVNAQTDIKEGEKVVIMAQHDQSLTYDKTITKRDVFIHPCEPKFISFEEQVNPMNVEEFETLKRLYQN